MNLIFILVIIINFVRANLKANTYTLLKNEDDVIQSLKYGYILTNVLLTKKTSISMTCCMKACISMTNCQSVNYLPLLTLCEINYKSETDYGLTLKQIGNAIYTRKNKWISDVECANEATIGSLVDCGIPAEPPHGHVDFSQGTGLYSKAVFDCYEGYVKRGKSVIGCQEDGSWSTSDFECIVDVPTVFIPSSSHLSIQKGSDVTLECNITSIGASVSSVKWVIRPDSQQSINFCRHSGRTTSSPDLKITNVLDSDQGKYQCTATNAQGTGYSNEVYLYILTDVFNPCSSCPDTYKCEVDNSVHMCLKYEPPGTSWKRDNYQFKCECDSGNLVRIDSAVKQRIVERYLHTINAIDNYIWIQGMRHSGTWMYLDGTTFNFTHWSTGQGDEHGDTAVVLDSGTNFRWHDARADPTVSVAGLCEFQIP